jgi:autotransporter-associated beta strand protein
VNGNTITYAGSLGNNGSGALTVKSSLANGVLILQGANTYTGTTTITNVTLVVNNISALGTGTGNVLVQNAGTLAGAGTLGGSVTVAAGGTLAPGSPFGDLAINNNLTLASGSQTLVQVQHLPLTNDAVVIGGIFTAGGTLVVTNSGGAAFTAGDSFTLFSAAGGYAGNFGSITLPALNPGLFWSTSRLAVDGTIGVVSTNPPAITSAGWLGGNLVLQGTGGTPNWPYTVISSPDLTLPLAQWTVTDTNGFDASGNFYWTNNASLSGALQFYMLKVQ